MSSRLFDALDHRFTDMDEVKDIAEQGCANCAPGGFIYYYETKEFFYEHEQEIEDYLTNIYGKSLYVDVAKKHPSINQMINKLVWILIEDYCTCKYGKFIETKGFEMLSA